MGISVLAEAQKEMRARWSKGGTVSTKKDEPKRFSNRSKSKPATKATHEVQGVDYSRLSVKQIASMTVPLSAEPLRA